MSRSTPYKYLSYQSDFLKSMDEVAELLIVVAMDSEEAALLEGLDVTDRCFGKSIPVRVREFQLPKCRVSIARSGVGLVNAGILLSTIADHRDLGAVVLLGVGGALDPSLNPGDVVVAKQVIQHDSIASQPEGAFGIAPGELTLSRPADQQIDPVMRCDSVLRAWVHGAVASERVGSVYEGTILSGSEFVASPERKAKLRAMASDALLVDMEAAALAQVSRRLGLPFIAAKTVSDRATPQGSVADDYLQFLNAANAHSRGVLQKILATFGM